MVTLAEDRAVRADRTGSQTYTVATVKAERLASQTYTVAQLAELLGVSERHIHRQRDLKRLPGEIRIGNCIRFARQIIDRWIAGGAN